ncbi:MAG: type I phosphomannose isomerase catalytic subunit [Terriglobia bacterium]
MLKLDRPLQLSPVFLEKVWGRKDLSPLYPDHWTSFRGKTVNVRRPERPGDALIGEVWLTGDGALFTNGPIAGMTLGEAMRAHGRELCGEAAAGGRFPILTKFLFTSQWLSVQVHPGDAYARENENGSPGKTEMWYFIEADKDGQIMLGLNSGVTTDLLGGAISQGSCAGLLRSFRPKPESAAFVPAGTAHALGPGLILFEAEQNSDLTYRLDDFGRPGLDGKPRPLHREKALAVIQAESQPLVNLPRYETEEPWGRRRWLVACPFFGVEELALRKAANFAGPLPRCECYAMIAGEGRVEMSDGWQAYRPGDVWLIPPATSAYRLAPEKPSRLLKFYVPRLDADFLEPLSRAGLSREEARKVVFT